MHCTCTPAPPNPPTSPPLGVGIQLTELTRGGSKNIYTHLSEMYTNGGSELKSAKGDRLFFTPFG